MYEKKKLNHTPIFAALAERRC